MTHAFVNGKGHIIMFGKDSCYNYESVPRNNIGFSQLILFCLHSLENIVHNVHANYRVAELHLLECDSQKIPPQTA